MTCQALTYSALGGISPRSSQPSQVSEQASTEASIWPLTAPHKHTAGSF